MCLNRKTELEESSMNPNLTILAIICALDDPQRARANFRLSSLVFREDHDDSDDGNSTVFKLNTINFLVSLIFPCLRAFRSPDQAGHSKAVPRGRSPVATRKDMQGPVTRASTSAAGTFSICSPKHDVRHGNRDNNLS